MGSAKRQQEIRAMRGHMWSPGRPSSARREDRVRFWQAIARGASSEEAAVEAGVSMPVGSRWFRHAGITDQAGPAFRRYLSFTEREEIAILYAQELGVREIARRIGRSPSTISRELVGCQNDSSRSDRSILLDEPAESPGGQPADDSGAASTISPPERPSS
jgi:transposase